VRRGRSCRRLDHAAGRHEGRAADAAFRRVLRRLARAASHWRRRGARGGAVLARSPIDPRRPAAHLGAPRRQGRAGHRRRRSRCARHARVRRRRQPARWLARLAAQGIPRHGRRARARDAARDGARVRQRRRLVRRGRVDDVDRRGGRRQGIRVTDAPPVVTRGLVKRYGDLVAVDHVDLTVERGDVFGYLGPNGAGKTTSLRMLLGLIRPSEGRAELFGRDPLVQGAKALDGVAGFVEGPAFYPYLSARRNLELLADYDDGPRSRIDEVLELVELRERARDRVGG